MKNGFAARTLLVAVIALLLVACGKPKGPGGEIWKEEVRLMNGDLIIVDRRNVYGSSGDLSVSQGPLVQAELSFEYKGNRYSWSQRGLGPVAIQVDSDGQVYIVSTIPYCWAWRERGKPGSYYVAHRFNGTNWVELAIENINRETIFNLAADSRIPRSKANRGFVSENDRKFKDSDFEPDRHIVPGYWNSVCGEKPGSEG